MSANFSPGPTSSGIVAVQVSWSLPCAGAFSSAIDTHRDMGITGGTRGLSCIYGEEIGKVSEDGGEDLEKIDGLPIKIFCNIFY